MTPAWKGGLGTLALALLLVALLTPSAEQGPRWPWFEEEYLSDPELLRAARFHNASRQQDAALTWAWRRVDTRERAQAASRNATPGLTLRFDPAVPPQLRADVERTVAAEVAMLGAGAPRHPVVVLSVVDPEDRSGRYNRATVLPADVHAPCAVVLRFSGEGLQAAHIPVTDRVLGTCAFHAAFGAPGRGMNAWLLATNMAAASYLVAPSAIAGDTAPLLFGRARSIDAFAALACIAGRAEGCARPFSSDTAAAALVRDPWTAAYRRPIVDSRDVAMHTSTSMTERDSRISDGLLSALATSLGPERFTRIWGSDRAPQEEFAAQEGRPLTEWTGEYFRSQAAPYHAGPMLPSERSLLVFALAIAAAMAALGWSRREIS